MTLHRWLVGLLILAVLLGGLGFVGSRLELPLLAHSRALPSRVPPATLGSSTSNLFAPSAAKSVHGGLYPPEAFPSPAVCGRCHVGIHRNWSRSSHSASATDRWYQKVEELAAFETGDYGTKLCKGCHAPVALLTGQTGAYDTKANGVTEGVSCIFCHSVASIHGGNGGYVSDPGRVRMYAGGDYLSEQAVEAAAHLVMAAPAVHKADMHPDWLHGVSGSQLCQACHQFTVNGVTVQSTYEEWRASSYYTQGISCQGCHFTPGAGVTAEPGHKVEHYPASYPSVLMHHLGGGSTVNAPDPETNRAILREAVELGAQLEGRTLKVTVTNVKAGHSLPTGVGDLRQMWLEVTATDASGRTVFTSGHLDKVGTLEPGTVLFHQVLGDANGRPLERHDIWRAAKVLEDTRIPAGGSKTTAFTVPPTASRVKVRLLWRDAPGRFAWLVLRQDGNSLPVAELASWESP